MIEARMRMQTWVYLETVDEYNDFVPATLCQ